MSIIIRFFFAGNFFISICAAMLCMQTFVVFEKDIDFTLTTFVFFATLSVYNMHSIVGHRKNTGHSRYIFIDNYLLYFQILAALSSILTALLLYLLPFILILSLLLISIPTLLYVIPFYKGIRMRDLPFLKIFLIGTVWPLVTVMLPIANLDIGYNTGFLLLFTERTLFILAIALAFDIRDIEFDKALNVKTIPATIGKEKTIWLIAIMLIIWTIISFIAYSFLIGSLLGIVALLTFLLAKGTLKNQKIIYYQLFLDGMLALQALIVLTFHK